MWENYPALHSRITLILGEVLSGRKLVFPLQIYSNMILATIYECYERPPVNFVKKGSNCLEFDIYFIPTTSSVELTDQAADVSDQINLIDENNIEFVMGRWTYKFSAEKIGFHKFKPLNFDAGDMQAKEMGSKQLAE